MLESSLAIFDPALLVYIKEQLGHSSIQITVDVYGHLEPGRNRQAVNSVTLWAYQRVTLPIASARVTKMPRGRILFMALRSLEYQTPWPEFVANVVDGFSRRYRRNRLYLGLSELE